MLFGRLGLLGEHWVKNIVFRVHALKRMAQRRISDEDISGVLETGEIIEDYPDDFPYPSRLLLGWSESRPIHVVVAFDEEKDQAVIITAYEPNDKEWDDQFRRRRK